MSENQIYQKLRGRLAALRMTAAAETLPAELAHARASGLSHTAFLELDYTSLHLIMRLGARAFEGISGEAVKVTLILWTSAAPALDQVTAGLDLSDVKGASQKAKVLRADTLHQCPQSDFRSNPMTIFTLDERVRSATLLQDIAASLGGITSGDSQRFRRAFWEVNRLPHGWVQQQLTPLETAPFTGRWAILDLEGARMAAENGDGATFAGSGAWGRAGVAVRYTGDLPVTLYSGEYFENVIAVIIPRSPTDLPAIWHFCCSPAFGSSVRRLDHTIGVKANTIAKVPFDIDHWRRVAKAGGPLPAPWSDDPTQWLFEGPPEKSTAPLQVAVARLLGYRWPAQAESDHLDGFADADGIVCLPSVAGEAPAADRVRQVLAGAYGDRWSPMRRSCWKRPEARKRRWPTGCGTTSSSSTARFSGADHSCGTSGTASVTGSRCW